MHMDAHGCTCNAHAMHMQCTCNAHGCTWMPHGCHMDAHAHVHPALIWRTATVRSPPAATVGAASLRLSRIDFSASSSALVSTHARKSVSRCGGARPVSHACATRYVPTCPPATYVRALILLLTLLRVPWRPQAARAVAARPLAPLRAAFPCSPPPPVVGTYARTYAHMYVRSKQQVIRSEQ